MSTNKERIALLLEKRTKEQKKDPLPASKTTKNLIDDFSVFSANVKNRTVDKKLDTIIEHLDKLNTKVKILEREVASLSPHNILIAVDKEPNDEDDIDVIERVDTNRAISMIKEFKKIYIKREMPDVQPYCEDSDLDRMDDDDIDSDGNLEEDD